MDGERESDTLPAGWEKRGKPPALNRRLTFSGYADTRRFMDWLAALSERDGYYPSTSFGTTYINITIDARDGQMLSGADLAFVAEIEAFYQQTAVSAEK